MIQNSCSRFRITVITKLSTLKTLKSLVMKPGFSQRVKNPERILKKLRVKYAGNINFEICTFVIDMTIYVSRAGVYLDSKPFSATLMITCENGYKATSQTIMLFHECNLESEELALRRRALRIVDIYLTCISLVFRGGGGGKMTINF